MVYIAMVLFVLVGLGVAVVAYENFGHDISLSFLGWTGPTTSVGIMLLVAFLLGAVLLYLVSIASAVRDVQEIKRLRTRVKELEQQLEASNPASTQSTSPASGGNGQPGNTLSTTGRTFPMPGLPARDISNMPTPPPPVFGE